MENVIKMAYFRRGYIFFERKLSSVFVFQSINMNKNRIRVILLSEWNGGKEHTHICHFFHIRNLRPRKFTLENA